MQWVRQCLLLLCRPSGDQQQQYPTMNEHSSLKKKHWPTHKSACAPCKTLKSEVRKSRETEPKTKAFFRSWGTTWLLAEIFPQPLLCLMRRSQCWDRLSRYNTEKYSWRIFFHAGVTHVPWLLLSCTWLQMQVKKTDPRINLQNA